MKSKPIRSVSFSHTNSKPSLENRRSISFNGFPSNYELYEGAGNNCFDEPAPEKIDITDGITYVIYEDHVTPRRRHSPKIKHTRKAIDFSKRGKVLDLSDDDPKMFYELDPEQFIKDLKRLDPNGWDPMPVNIMWAWNEVDKKGNAIVSRKDMYRLMKKYNSTVASSINVLNLIRKCDKNKDQILDASEIHELLSLACGKEVSRSDSTVVLSRLEAMAKSSTHGGYDCTMTSDPIIVSKTIFEWWWVYQDNRGAILRRIEAARLGSAPPPTRDEELAELVRQGDVGVTDMNNSSLEDDLPVRSDALDLGLSLLRSIGDNVHKACSPLGQAFAGCANRR